MRFNPKTETRAAQAWEAKRDAARPKPIHTPWGPSDGTNELAPGVVMHHTASHGGFWVSPEVRAEWPAELRDWPTFGGTPGWYEEDCDWAVVAIAMPQLFTPEMREMAANIAHHYLTTGPRSLAGFLCRSTANPAV